MSTNWLSIAVAWFSWMRPTSHHQGRYQQMNEHNGWESLEFIIVFLSHVIFTWWLELLWITFKALQSSFVDAAWNVIAAHRRFRITCLRRTSLRCTLHLLRNSLGPIRKTSIWQVLECCSYGCPVPCSYEWILFAGPSCMIVFSMYIHVCNCVYTPVQLSPLVTPLLKTSF